MKRLLFVISLLAFSLSGMSQEIQKDYINPSSGYTNVVAVTTGDVTTLYVAGQVGNGATMEEQIRSAFQGVLKQLSDAGAEFGDVVKMNTYIVNYREEDLATFRGVREELFGNQKMPANTLVGVTSLARDAYKVEIEAIAVVTAK